MLYNHGKCGTEVQTPSIDAFAGCFHYQCIYQNGWSGHKEIE
jgi:hypothetical protein